MKRKIISVLLCVTLIVSVTPVVYAQNTTDVTPPIVTNDENAVQTAREPYIVGEIVEKRTEDTKHFLMSDRSVMAAMYNQTVHYNDGENWLEVDNSFSTNSENIRQGTVLCLLLKEKYINKFHEKGISIRQIARLCGVSKGIVEKYLR